MTTKESYRERQENELEALQVRNQLTKKLSEEFCLELQIEFCPALFSLYFQFLE